MNKKPSVFSIIKHYGGSKRKYLLPSSILQIITAFTSLVPYYCIWKIVQSVFYSYPVFDSGLIREYLLIAVTAQIFSTLCAFTASIFAHLIAFEVENGLREAGFSHLLDLPLGYLQAHESGRLRKIIDDNAGLTHSFIAHQLPDMIPGILVPLIVFISMFVIDFRFGLILLLSLVLAMVVLKSSFSPTNRARMDAYQHALENINAEGVEYFRGIPVVKVFQQSVLSFNRFHKAIKDYEQYCLDYTINFRNSYILMNIILYLPYMLIGVVAILLLPSSPEPLRLITNAIFYMLMTVVFTMSLMRLSKLATGMNGFTIAIGKIDELLDIKPLETMEIPDENHGEASDTTSIFVDDISFSYDGERKVLDHVSYSFERGKSYALVGKSGSGKSTLVNLIGRFFDVDSGGIYIEGKNIKTLSENDIFKNVSMVFQKQRLLKDSIFENVRMYDQSKGEEDVKRVLSNAHAMEFVDALDEGIYTTYGSSGTYFSGGEVQRIALARAFLKDSPILLLDEAMAFVDADNEAEIHKAINKLKENRTTIMILHRLSSAESFDEILMMDDGRIIGAGPHERLVESCEAYGKLYEEYRKTVNWRVTND